MRIRIVSHAIGAPFDKMWGDYWVVKHLEKGFIKLGHVIVPKKSNQPADINFYLVGGSYPKKNWKPAKKHVAWFYSHIDSPTIKELNNYDLVMCLGLPYMEKLKKQIKTPVVPLIGCTHVVPPDTIPEKTRDVVMCGNTKIPVVQLNKSTKYGRWIIDHLDPVKNNINLELYGLRWNNFPMAKKFHKANYWDNVKLPELYGSAKICLNDSHVGMRQNGFVTIRTYDIIASGSLCISINIPGVTDIFEDVIVTYKTPTELQQLVKYYLKHDDERNAKIKKGIELIKHKNFNYYEKAREIMAQIKKYTK